MGTPSMPQGPRWAPYLEIAIVVGMLAAVAVLARWCVS